MPAPSEAFKWLLFPGARRVCWQCGREPLRIQDVGEHRRKYPGTKDEFLCKSCVQENVQKKVRDKRKALGWDT